MDVVPDVPDAAAIGDVVDEEQVWQAEISDAPHGLFGASLGEPLRTDLARVTLAERDAARVSS